MDFVIFVDLAQQPIRIIFTLYATNENERCVEVSSGSRYLNYKLKRLGVPQNVDIFTGPCNYI